jgi:hypothetical protein
MKVCFGALLACAAFLGTAEAALAWGTVGGEGRVLTGCDAQQTGPLRVVEGQNRCPRKQIRVSWNCAGPKADPGIMDAAGAAGNTGATGRHGVLDEIGSEGADGASGPAWTWGENGPEGDSGAPGADGDKWANGAPGPSTVRKGRRGDNAAPGAMGESGHARAPPPVLSASRTGRGA